MSRIERILQAIIDGTSYNEAPQSRIEEILLAIKNNTQCSDLPQSRIEEILLAIKSNTSYIKEPMSRIEEILLAKLNGLEYTKLPQSRIEELLIEWRITTTYKGLTGVPPLTFVSNGENLVDYRIDGASGGVGDRTENLWNEKSAIDTNIYINANGNSVVGSFGDRFLGNYISVNPSTKYVFKWSENVLGAENNTAYIRISEYTQNSDFIKRTLCNCSEQPQKEFSFTTGSNTANIDVRTDSETSSRGQHLTGVMLTLGNIPPETYEPYGYKIPIVCGGATTNIYLNEPLGENESISMSDTGVSIPTINGSNTLSVDTAVQPNNVYLKYKGG